MKHLLEYESYQLPVNEGAIAVFDEDKLIKDLKSKPEMEIKFTQIPSVVESLLSKVQSGEYKEVKVLADVPTQGKRAPQYVRDLMDKERERVDKRNTAIYGSRVEKVDRPEDDTEQRGAINVFVDSEYVVNKVVKDASGDYLVTTPASFVTKVKTQPSLADYYTVNIYPNQVEEVYFVKA